MMCVLIEEVIILLIVIGLIVVRLFLVWSWERFMIWLVSCLSWLVFVEMCVVKMCICVGLFVVDLIVLVSRFIVFIGVFSLWFVFVMKFCCIWFSCFCLVILWMISRMRWLLIMFVLVDIRCGFRLRLLWVIFIDFVMEFLVFWMLWMSWCSLGLFIVELILMLKWVVVCDVVRISFEVLMMVVVLFMLCRILVMLVGIVSDVFFCMCVLVWYVYIMSREMLMLIISLMVSEDSVSCGKVMF